MWRTDLHGVLRSESAELRLDNRKVLGVLERSLIRGGSPVLLSVGSHPAIQGRGGKSSACCVLDEEGGKSDKSGKLLHCMDVVEVGVRRAEELRRQGIVVGRLYRFRAPDDSGIED
jgi:hypothetical protein